MGLEDSSRNTCVGVGELSRDTIVSPAGCDLYNVSREAGSTELLGGSNLSARNIFLSGGYELAAGAVMTASIYLTTHTSPAADPYSGLKVPPIPDAREPATGWTSNRPKPFRRASIAGGGATLNLEPGTYILDRGNFVVSGNSTVSGTGVTLILTSRTRSDYGAIDIRAGSTIEVTAPALGAAAGIPGIAIRVDGHAPATSDSFDGGVTQNINGAIYLPGRQVEYSGGLPSATRCSQLITQAVTFTGNSYFRHDCAGAAYPTRTRRLSSPSDPRLPSGVGQRQGRMGEHPAGRGDVEIGVRVVERRHRLRERRNEKGEPDDRRPGREEPACSPHPVRWSNTGEKSIPDSKIDRPCC